MRSLSEIRESPNFERLIHSVEMKAAKKDALISGIILAIFVLLIFIPDTDSGDKGFLWLALLFGLLPLLVHTLYRLAEIFFHINSYTFTEAMLDHPRQGLRGVMAFTVTLRDGRGREFQTDTSFIFCRGEPNFEDYVNQKALIGYNSETNRVVVIKRLP